MKPFTPLFALFFLLTTAGHMLASALPPKPGICKLSISQCLAGIKAAKVQQSAEAKDKYLSNLLSLKERLKTACTTAVEHPNFCVAHYHDIEPKVEDFYSIFNYNRDEGAFNGSGAFFGLYDGTDGAKIARLAAQTLHTRIFNHKDFASNMSRAITDSFNGFDSDLWMLGKNKNNTAIADNQRAAAVIALIRNKELYLAWLGDARFVVAINNSYLQSTDHTPDAFRESCRLKEAGAEIAAGQIKKAHKSLPVSRALGAHIFKSAGVIPTPEMSYLKIASNHQFMILANKGIWDTMNNGDACAIVKEALETHKSCAAAASILVNSAILRAHKQGATKNMTAIVVSLRNLAFTNEPNIGMRLYSSAEEKDQEKDETLAEYLEKDESPFELTDSSSSDSGDTFASATTASEPIELD